MCQPERFLQAGLAGDQAMMLQQRGFAVLQRYRDSSDSSRVPKVA